MLAERPSCAYRTTAVALILVAIVGHAAFLRQSTSPDVEMFVYMGKLVATGGRPGIDLIDNKFPTVGLLMSVPYRLLGANWRAYGLLSLAATIGAAFVLARGARRTFGPKTYWPTLVAAMVWGNFFICIFSIFQLEHLQLLLGAIAGAAALAALREPDWRDALVVGLCAGLSAWLKPNGLSVAGALGIMLLLRSQWKLLATTVIGGMIPTAVCIACLHASGTLALLPEITRQIGRYAGHSAWNVSEVAAKLFDLFLLFVLPFLIAFSLSLYAGRGRGRGFQRGGHSMNHERSLREGPLPNPLPGYRVREVAFLLLWIALEFVGGMLQGRMFSYYFLPMAAPAALLFGRFANAQTAARLVAAFVAPLGVATLGIVILWANTGGVDDKQKVVAYLRDHNLAGGKAWVDDYPRLAVESDWTPASRLPLINLLTNDDEAPIHFGQLLLSDLKQNEPDVIALRTDEAKFVNFFTRRQEDVAASPVRQERMTRAIHELYQYALDRYQPAVRCGGYTIWQKCADSRNTATADASGGAR